MISIKSHSGIYTLEVRQQIHTTLDVTWNFFSTPSNLTKITPKHMGFEITSDNLTQTYEGQIITYMVGIMPGIKSPWVTEITHVTDQKYFVDEQRFGPYAMWHHEHIFEEKNGAVIMTDRVSYKPPLGIIGRLMHSLFIKRQLLKIFRHRYDSLENFFGTPPKL
ncbi:SRPBCC family protein [Gilvimarinus agarilyticus]|uniref:SRPBCC family protein n=1 Tax=Reichenbachiella TaxID=156993 RepID=UPI000E6CF2EE|nr:MULTISPECIES: SRPBCC family protein [Reichenbachiella]MBU2885751.1 SRPBCC family protein [Gilvimarinus agarilyticus]RJE72063.1 hypothetical protein BGP76_08295 [Reichenbachiella sp. MSK19-1]